MANSNIRAVVLAAGKSTRFKTKKSKLLFNICGRTMILYPLKILEELEIPVTLVLGHQADTVKEEISKFHVKSIDYAIQREPLGTGHAVACAQGTWVNAKDVIILYGDMPLISSEIIESLIDEHEQEGATLTFLTSLVFNPSGYGRVIEAKGMYKIIEDKDCTPEQKHINKINAGIYMINRQWLDKNISKLTANPLTGEIYIVDLVNIACEQGEKVRTISVPYDNVRGVNTLHDLWGVEQIKRSEFIRYWMSEGVRFELAQSIHIDINVRIGAGSFIGTGAHLLGNTIIGEDCFVGAFSIVENTTIGNSSTIHSHSVIQESHIGCDVHVGPFARLRNNVVLGDNVEIGNFVEIKRSTIGAGSKTKHLTYLGDTTAGKGVNIGAGTITCNYDGKNKFATIIEDEVFIGSNNTLVAPLRIGKGSYTAGGSTITQDVPRGCLALGRSRQENKLDYAQRLLNDNKESDDNAQESEEVKKKLNDGETLAVSFRGALKTRSENKESL